MKTYELFSGQDLIIAEKIQQRRLQILVHSCIYYKFNQNKITDKQWDTFAKELVDLQKQYPKIAEQVIWNDAFADFDATTGFKLPLDDSWVIKKAQQLIGVSNQQSQKVKKKKGRLF